MPLHCAALGKVLLAYGAAELPPGRLERRTSRTLTSRAELDANLAEVRERGYAVTDEELEPGLVAVAAPVFAATAAPWWPRCRCPPRPPGSPRPGYPAVAAECAATAVGVSAALGHRPPAPGTLRHRHQAAPPEASPQKEGAA